MWGPANGLLEEHLSGDQRGLTPRVFELLFARISEVMLGVVCLHSVSLGSMLKKLFSFVCRSK